MSVFPKIIPISNPSDEIRDDYVQIDLNHLGIPAEYDEIHLELIRYPDDDKDNDAIPIQIDLITGDPSGPRILTFLARNIPKGKDDYSDVSATFILQEKKTQSKDTLIDKNGQGSPPPSYPYIGYYYIGKTNVDYQHDDFCLKWDKTRKLRGVKLFNEIIEPYIRIHPDPPSRLGTSLIGAITSLYHKEMEKSTTDKNFLNPRHKSYGEERWGQIYKIGFTPLPWEKKPFHQIDLLDPRSNLEYNLVYAKSGPVRAIIVLKSNLLKVPYNPNPYVTTPLFDRKNELSANFYRVLYLHSGFYQPYYMEDLFVLTDDMHQRSISFQPSFQAKLPLKVEPTSLNRLIDVPDYFSVSKELAIEHRIFGFASNTHIAAVESDGENVCWNLPVTHHCNCVHFFTFYMPDWDPSSRPNPFHVIGHEGWYKKLYKPILPFEPNLRVSNPIQYM